MHGQGKGQAGMVGRSAPQVMMSIGTLGKSIGYAEVQLTGLVAAGAAKQVVTLDVNVDFTAQGHGKLGRYSIGVLTSFT